MATSTDFMKVDTEQLQKTLAIFRDMPGELHDKIIKSALRKAGKIFKEAVIDQAPVGETGALSDGIRFTIREINGNEHWAIVYTGRKQYYGYMVEYGHRVGSADKVEWFSKKRESRKQSFVPPNPFMRRAFEGNYQRVITEMARNTDRMITRWFLSRAAKSK